MTCFRCNHLSQLFQISGIYKLLWWLDDTYGLTNQFDERTPEEKAAMLGSVAGLLVPGIQVTKTGKAGKVFSGVEDVVSPGGEGCPERNQVEAPGAGSGLTDTGRAGL
ncbi:hypothetical protein NYE33_09900 [Paenibacillus sp. FSL R10-2199]|uniref:hypothetical protein n=1 Tax=Paenibacillus sp. FSL R10-2199 TaxID=2975348 RepID=UPI0030FC8E3A